MSGTWVHHSPDLMKRKERRWKKHVEIFWAVWACQIGESCWDRVPHQILRGSPQNIQHWMDMTIVDGHVLGQFAKAFSAMRRNFWWHMDQSSLSSSGAQVTRLAWWYIDMPCNLMYTWCQFCAHRPEYKHTKQDKTSTYTPARVRTALLVSRWGLEWHIQTTHWTEVDRPKTSCVCLRNETETDFPCYIWYILIQVKWGLNDFLMIS